MAVDSSPMKLLFWIAAYCLCAVFSVTLADTGAKIVNYEYGIEEDGSFESRYETTNGISSEESGISYPGNELGTGNYVRSGSYSYTWDGVTYTVTWTADENGYRPQGDHLPDYTQNTNLFGDVESFE